MIKSFFIFLLVFNIYSFLLMCYDKWRAKNNEWRVSEKVLLLHAFFLGSIGILLGIYSPLKHKRNDWKFSIGVPIIILLQIASVILFIKYTLQAVINLFS
jgi:uncharacterized membrane protein YsdA (DUF1294 family)